MNLRLLQEYYESKEYLDKLRDKVSILKEMEQDSYARQAKILDTYANDPIKFIEHFLMIKNPKLDGSPKPFFLFDYQKDIINKMQELENGGQEAEFLTDKPREMGITWLMSAYFLWRYLFTPNYSAFILSRSESEVDDGTRQCDGSIFGKMRWMLDRLPTYLIPEGYKKKVQRGTTTDMNLKLINPDIGSSLTGSSTNSSAGRSRRYTTTYIDEAFFIDQFQQVYRSLQSVSKVKILTSTVIQGRVFEDFKNTLDTQGNYMSLSWKDHPFKDQEWYNEMVAKAEQMNDPDIMREVEPSYAISSKSAYYPDAQKSTIDSIEYDKRYPLYVSMDIGGKQDLTVIIWWQYNGQYFDCIDAYYNRNKDIPWYVPFLNPEVEYNPDKYTKHQQDIIEEKRTWRKPTMYFGEADHFAQRHPSNTSSAQVLAQYGIRLIYNRYAIQHPPRHTALSQLLPRIRFNQDRDGAMRVFDGIAQSRYPDTVKPTTENLKPVHDEEIADFRASAENFAVNIGRLFRKQREEVAKGGDKDFASAMIKKLRV